jgi:DNA-binding NarL/FixJ family response regulator
LVEDKRASVPDQVAAKMDVGAWFATLTKRMKQIARDLAFGFSTSEVARKYGVTAGRISQLRRALENSWAEFQRESLPVVV